MRPSWLVSRSPIQTIAGPFAGAGGAVCANTLAAQPDAIRIRLSWMLLRRNVGDRGIRVISGSWSGENSRHYRGVGACAKPALQFLPATPLPTFRQGRHVRCVIAMVR